MLEKASKALYKGLEKSSKVANKLKLKKISKGLKDSANFSKKIKYMKHDVDRFNHFIFSK